MSLRQPRFQIHKAQKIAAALLLICAIQELWLVAHRPLTMAETRNALAGKALWSSSQLGNARSPLIPGDSILTLRLAGILPAIARHWPRNDTKFSVYAAPSRWLVRLPFVAFGLWLGGALWWVARRIFGDEGGYVALGLYCFSPPMLIAGASADSAILASWGLFGLVFTGIGVAHTLYAPAKRWRPRILLLGLAIGLTAAASVGAAVAGLLLATVFMLYLAPGRRLYSLMIVMIGSAVGGVVFLLCFGFNIRDLNAAGLIPNSEYLHFTVRRVGAFQSVPGAMLEIVTFVACTLVFLLWRRTQYFGNLAPLVVALVLPWWPGEFFPSGSVIWSLPFAMVFVGGIYGDLLERRSFAGRFRKLVACTAFVVLGASAVLSLMVVTGT
jgi:hypothetical protein